MINGVFFFRNKNVHDLLEKYSPPNHNTSYIQGPRAIWVWHAISPAVLYGLVIFICTIMNHRQGLVMLFSLLAMGFVANQQSHRLRHVSGSVNSD